MYNTTQVARIRQPNLDRMKKLSDEIAAEPPMPWRQLSDDEALIWFEICKTRTRAEWIGIDTHIAVELCRLLIKLRKLDDELEDEGYLIADRWGTKKANPLITIINGLWDRVVRLQGRLNISPAALQIEKNRLESTRNQAKQIEGNAEQAKEDADTDLIPTIGMQPRPTIVNGNQPAAQVG